MIVDYAGLSKAEVLATLFNASRPMGMGFLQAGNGPQVMSVEYAEALLGGARQSSDYPELPGGMGPNARGGQSFDYLYGRPLKLNLSGDTTEFDAWGFDRDNGGEGSAQTLIAMAKVHKMNSLKSNG